MFIATSLFLFCLLAIGNLFLQFPRRTFSILDRLALSFSIGILFDYSLILTGLSFSTIQNIIAILSLIGAGFWFMNLKAAPFRIRLGTIAFIFYFLAILLIKETSEGLIEWDARSIWFFNAKILWHAGGMSPSIEYNHPSLIWTAVFDPAFGSIPWAHPDYPKLIPAIAAQIAHYFGFWNDYLTKISIFLVLSAPVFIISRFAHWSFSFVMLCLTLYCSQFAVLWNGYMDGGTALFICLPVYLLIRYHDRKDPIDFVFAIISTGFLFCLKNEGLLLGLCAWGSYFILLRKTLLSSGKKMILVASAAMIPTLLWMFRKSQFGLKADFKFLSPETFQKVSTRLQDGSLSLIFHDLLIKHSYTWKAFALLLSLLFFVPLITRRKWKTIPKAILFPLFAGCLYLAAMFLIYLSTPFKLEFHLNTSIDRTLISFYALFLIGVVKILDWINSDLGDTNH